MTQETRLPTTMSRDPHLRWRETRSLDVSEREVQRRLSSAADIIREIGALPFEEQLKIIAFSKELEKNRELTRGEFIALAQRYQDATNPTQLSGLEDELVQAFYGPKGHS